MNLFEDFKPVSHQDWIDKINQDLKGKNFEETLVWKTDEGIDVQPFYNSSDLNNNNSQYFNFTTPNKLDWEIREQIVIENIFSANISALNALKGGANSIQFNGVINNQAEMDSLLSNIMVDIIHIHFYNNQPQLTQDLFVNHLKKKDLDKSKINYSITYDFLGELLNHGNWVKTEEEDFKHLYSIYGSSSLYSITVNGLIYANAGATIVQELAFSLAQAIDYVDRLTNKGFNVEEVLNNISFQLGVNSNYFFEIAKIRALRILWQLIGKSYGLENLPSPYIHSQTTTYNIAAQDAQTNILRTTTEGMSAIIGGCNSLSISPYNYTFENPTDFSSRIARNIQIILKEEAFLNKVDDASKGSYYIENLTDELVSKSLTLFKEIESSGGFLENIKSDTIQDAIINVNTKKVNDFKEGKRTLLGVNIHLNKMEKTPISKLTAEVNFETPIKRLPQINVPSLISQTEQVNP